MNPGATLTGKVRGWEVQRVDHRDGHRQYLIERADGRFHTVPQRSHHLRDEIDAAVERTGGVPGTFNGQGERR